MSNPEIGKQHIVIFSHGFGVLKDSRGLFTELSDMLSNHGIQSVLFDYNEIRLETNEVVVKPFSEQAKILQNVIVVPHKTLNYLFCYHWQLQWV